VTFQIKCDSEIKNEEIQTEYLHPIFVFAANRDEEINKKSAIIIAHSGNKLKRVREREREREIFTLLLTN
jgi:hypothetical protein